MRRRQATSATFTRVPNELVSCGHPIMFRLHSSGPCRITRSFPSFHTSPRPRANLTSRYLSTPAEQTFSGKPKDRPRQLTDSLGTVRGGMKGGFAGMPAHLTPPKPIINPNAKPEVNLFSDSAQPGSRRGLPRIPRVWPKVLGGLLIALPLWSGFLFSVWNQEKLTSSIFLQARYIHSATHLCAPY